MRYPPLRRSLLIVTAFIFLSFLLSINVGAVKMIPREKESEYLGVVQLPEPKLEGLMSVEEAIYRRRSIRDYKNEPLTLKEVGQLLWAAQGITLPTTGFRSVPSAGATYPLKLYLSVKRGGVVGLASGIYRYDPLAHALYLMREGDHSLELMRAALDQRWVGEAPICIVVAAEFERTTSVYGERGIRYVYMEAGHAGQNIYLQATALDLGTVAVGAFYDDEVKAVVGCGEDIVYLFPVGRR